MVYLSDDKEVCTVDASGMVIFTGVGSTEIEVSYLCATDYVLVTVEQGFAAAADTMHRYSFNGEASEGPEEGVYEEDLISGADGIVWYAQYDGEGKLLFDNADADACPYVDLPNSLFTDLRSENGSFTIEWWANATREGGQWQRFFSFGESTTTGAAEGLETGEHDETCPFPAGNGSRFFDIVAKQAATANMRVEVRDAVGGSSSFINNFAFPSNQEIHWVLTYDQGCNAMILYQDGKPVQNISGIDAENLDDINDVNNWIGRASYNGNAVFDGSFSEVRMYTGVMNGLQVSQSFVAGPDAEDLLPDPGTLESIEVTPELMSIVDSSPVAERQLDTIATFSLAGSLDISGLSDLKYTSSDEGVVTVDRTGLVNVVGGGAATVTVSYAHPSGTKTDTVTVEVEALSGIEIATPSGTASVYVDGEVAPAVPFRALANYDTVTGVDITTNAGTVWSTDDESGDVLTVSATGVVTPVDYGSATVSVDYEGTMTSLLVTVEDVPVKTPVLKHHYTFNYPSDTTATSVPDSAGSADGTVVNDGFYYDGESLVLPGGPIADETTTASFVDLPNGMISGLDTTVYGNAHSFEMWLTVYSQDDWSRAFSFGSSDQGEGLSGTGRTYLYFTPKNGNTTFPGAAYTLNSSGAETTRLDDVAEFPDATESHVVITYDADAGISKLYVDGFLADSGYVDPADPLSALNDVNNWLGRGQYNNSLPEMDINEFNIYCGILSDDDVEAHIADGPDDTPLAVEANLSLGIRQGPGMGQVTLFWPNSTAEGAILESSTNLLAPWTPVPGSDSPTDINGNFEFTVPVSKKVEAFRLNDAP